MSILKGERPPAEEHLCVNCGKRLAPNYETEWRRFGEPGHIWSERWYTGKIRGYGVGGEFCTNVCALRYGLRAARAGVRFKGYDVERVAVWNPDAARKEERHAGK